MDSARLASGDERLHSDAEGLAEDAATAAEREAEQRRKHRAGDTDHDD